MKAFRWRVSPLKFSVAAGLILALCLGGAILGQGQGTAAKQGTVDHIKVHGKSLEGNLQNDSPDRYVFVYLPPSYSTDSTRRYPVVYMLHGYGLTAERWMPFTKMAEAADKDIAAGTMKEMILVKTIRVSK
jgi:enterochelin esterase-like enzyme